MNILKLLTIVLPMTLGACAITRVPSQNLLEERADYGSVREVKDALEEVDHPLLVPVRTNPTVADIWVHPHELANGDYFRGGWIRTVVTRSQWMVEEEQKPLLIKKDEKAKTESSSGGIRHDQLK